MIERATFTPGDKLGRLDESDKVMRDHKLGLLAAADAADVTPEAREGVALKAAVIGLPPAVIADAMGAVDHDAAEIRRMRAEVERDKRQVARDRARTAAFMLEQGIR